MASVREWKPGDVAMIPGCGPRVMTERGWATAQGNFVKQGQFQNARPLVVIDPEDREQVERLTRIYYGDKDGGPTPHDDRMQAALREFANPTPPIEEPQGLGAVVIDANDHRWLRGNTDADDEEPWYSDQFGWEPWSEIKAVRVLSEGIPAEAKS